MAQNKMRLPQVCYVCYSISVNVFFLLVGSQQSSGLLESEFHADRGIGDNQQCHEATYATQNIDDALQGHEDKEVGMGQEIVDWVRNRRGYVNPKLEIRREHPGNMSSIMGIFATARIETNELLESIPWNLLVKPADKIFEENAGNILDNASTWCEGIYAVIHEMKLGDASNFAPYVRYLLTRPSGVVPGVWSKDGRKLLAKVLGDHLLPKAIDFEVNFWRDQCGGSKKNNPFEEHIAMLVQTRAEDLLMVPFGDMHNHRNGPWLNAKVNYANVIGTPFEMLASRTIEVGEQIYTSYNMCSMCEGRSQDHLYGTPHILRDYGFVEQLPQRWIFSDGKTDIKFDLEENDDGSTLRVVWAEHPPTFFELHYLRNEHKRLANVAQSKRQFALGENRVPENEWNIIWQYHDALTVALSSAIRDFKHKITSTLANIRTMKDIQIKTELRYRGIGFEQVTDNEQLVQLLLPARVNRVTAETGTEDGSCVNFLNQDGYVDVSQEKSTYQSILFEEHTSKADVCMTLDTTVQICACYRPHYHEPFVHFPAAYLQGPLRHVAFVGGGDSMLLHEIMKYPTIERVVALELDQKVVRSSFKNFATQPHFHDERVQWWFGDAVKSLQLLPRHYFRSFDLVLVDLSETVMSAFVTEDLDIFGALALLLKPEGIFVKNELFVGINDMSRLFQHAIVLYMPDVPMICHQDWVMGSNQVDFLTQPNFKLLKEHSVPTLFFEPLVSAHDHYGLIESYSYNGGQSAEKCDNELDEPLINDVSRDKEKVNAGILMIVEVEEGIDGHLPEPKQMEAMFLAVLQNDDVATPLSSVAYSSDHHAGGGSLVIVMKEGFVSAHTWPDDKYCALDIHLWGAFERQDLIRAALLEALGVSFADLSFSSYRIIVGGMLGSHTADIDKEVIGPPRDKKSHINCDSDKANRNEPVPLDTNFVLSSIIEESLNLIRDNDSISVAVICGYNGPNGHCQGIEVLKKATSISKVVAIWSCSPSDSSTGDQVLHDRSDDGVIHQSLCNGWEGVFTSIKDDDKLHAIFVDPGTPANVVREAAYLCGIQQEDSFRRMIYVVPTLDYDLDDFARRNFLDVCLYSLRMDPKHAVDITVNGTTKDVSIVSSGNRKIIDFLFDFPGNLKEHYSIDSKVKTVKGKHKYHQDNHDAFHFTLDDYDRRPAMEQFSSQQPLSHQSIFAFEVARDSVANVSLSVLRHAMDNALARFVSDGARLHQSSDVGDGVVLVAVLSDGHVIVVWDGGMHIHINIFTYGMKIKNHKMEIVDPFGKSLPTARLVQQDEQPRGYGRVVNFAEDVYVRPGCSDHSSTCAAVHKHFCKSPETKRWAEVNCKRTCGLC